MPARKNTSRSLRAVALSTLPLFAASAARADTFNWIGTPTSNSWSDPANWLNLTNPSATPSYPTTTDTAILDTGGYNSINLLSPTLSLDTLQLPGRSNYGFFGQPSTGSPPYTLSSNNGTGSTILQVNQITAGSNGAFAGADSRSNIIDSTVTLQGPESSPLAITLRRDLSIQGPVIAPGGITVISGPTVDDGGVLNLSGTSNSISSLNLSGPVNAYGPGSIQNAAINFGQGFTSSNLLTLISDLPLANYNNNININSNGS
ncbi:MAG TPA: hypothetical protein VFE58_10270, partial [Tepidisphaeraceae bacterium]|nr:hypothetical protein [Tepidisphaeraceae bacterium]